MRTFGFLLLSASSLLFAGCSANFESTPPVLGAASAGIQGKAVGGQQPVGGATVTVYEAGTSGYGTGATAKANVTTDAGGNFQFAANAYTCTAANSPMYVVATGGNPGSGTNANLALAASLGPCATAKTSFVVVNEVTTAATVLALGQFMGTTLGASGTAFNIGGTCTGCATGVYNQGLVRAMTYTYPQLVDNPTGSAIANHAAGSVSVTTEAAKLYTIANVLAACVNSMGQTSATETTTNCGKLFTGVNAKNAATRASDTLQAALEMQLYPYYNVAAVYALSTATPPFVGLGSAPNDWTVAISYRTTGFGLGIQQNTSSNLDIDAAGNVWVPSNQTSAIGLTMFDPSGFAFSGPYGGSALAVPQYVAIDQSATAYAWVTDLASSNVAGVSTVAPATKISLSSNAFTSGGPLTLDNSNNVLLAGGGATQSFYVIPPARTSLTQAMYSVVGNSGSFTPSAFPNGIAVPLSVPYTNSYVFAGDSTTACNLEFSPGTPGSDKVSTGTSTCVIGGVLSIIHFNNGYATTSTGAFCYYVPFESVSGCPVFASLSNPKGLAYDGAGHFWIANAGNASVASFSINTTTTFGTPAAIGSGYLHGSANGGTLVTPYGIGVDGSGNVWVSNASCVATTTTRCSANGLTLTEIVGAAAPTITPVSAQETGNAGQNGTRPTS